MIVGYVWQILGRGAFLAHHTWAAPKSPILNRVDPTASINIYHNIIPLIISSLNQHSILQRKSPLHYVGQYLARDTKSFLTSLTCVYVWSVILCQPWCQILQVIRENFPGRISPQPQEYEVRLVTVTHEPFPKPSTTFFAFSQEKHFFFSTSWKYWRLPI